MIREAVGLSNGTWAHFMPVGKHRPRPSFASTYMPSSGNRCLLSFRREHHGHPGKTADAAGKLLLEWLKAERDRARLYFLLQDGLSGTSAGEAMTERISEIVSRVAKWGTAAMTAKKPPPAEHCLALVFGPAIALARSWACTEDVAPLSDAVPFVPTCAWLRTGGTQHARSKQRLKGAEKTSDLFKQQSSKATGRPFQYLSRMLPQDPPSFV